jgi:mannose-6-phosphate isomerase-like protein (cupin superfamily)
MFITDLNEREEIVAGDNSILRELFNPLRDDVAVGYSLAHAKVKPGEITYAHRLKSSEVYYILEGEGEMYIDDERKKVFAGQVIYIPPNSVQRIKNTEAHDLAFLCIVDPAWRAEDEELVG